MASINVALAAASADYIVWAAADDVFSHTSSSAITRDPERPPRAGVSLSLATFQDGTETVREYCEETGMGPALISEPNHTS